MSRKPANKIAQKSCWKKKIAARKRIEAELELLRLFFDDVKKS
jgi:hypothetical protein